jgi:hypothetical protein
MIRVGLAVGRRPQARVERVGVEVDQVLADEHPVGGAASSPSASTLACAVISR